MKARRRSPVVLVKKRQRRYAVIIERGPRNLSASVPDLPGCVSTGRTLAEVRRHIREAIAFHIEGTEEGGDPVPEPTTSCEMVKV
jgi:predicted RNase H-like HicB family nuclease